MGNYGIEVNNKRQVRDVFDAFDATDAIVVANWLMGLERFRLASGLIKFEDVVSNFSGKAHWISFYFFWKNNPQVPLIIFFWKYPIEIILKKHTLSPSF